MSDAIRPYTWRAADRAVLQRASQVYLGDPVAFVQAILHVLPLYVRTRVLCVVDPGLADESLRAERRAELDALASAGFSRATVMSIRDERTCAVCRAHDGRTYLISEAIASSPLPCRGCTCHLASGGARPTCQCLWVLEARAVPERGILGVARR